VALFDLRAAAYASVTVDGGTSPSDRIQDLARHLNRRRGTTSALTFPADFDCRAHARVDVLRDLETA